MISPFDHFAFLFNLKIYSFPSSLIDQDSATPGKFPPPYGLAIVNPSHREIKIWCSGTPVTTCGSIPCGSEPLPK